MIARGKSISHIVPSIRYACKEEAVILDKNIVSDTAKGVSEEFKLFQDLNSRCERNTLSFVISPSISDGKRLDTSDLIDINNRFLSCMGLEQHQYIAFTHTDKPHKHIHLYVNRIDPSGKAYNDQFIGNRCAQAAEGIAKDLGLQTAKESQLAKKLEHSSHHSELSKIKNLSDHVLSDRSIDTLDKFSSRFNKLGQPYDLHVSPYHNQSGSFQGFRFFSGTAKFKASDVDRRLSKQNLSRTLYRRFSQQQEQGLSMDF